MSEPIPFADVKRELQARVRSLVKELAPSGHFAGGYYMAKNPARDDRKPGSFWIRLTGQAIGAWREEATGEKGDIVDLVTYLARLPDRAATYKWCLSWLGWSQGIDRNKLDAKRKAAAYVEKQEATLAAEEAKKNRNRALAMFLNAREVGLQSPVATYLASRGIDLARFAHLPGAIRFVPECRHIDEDGVITEWPAMIAAMCDAKGEIAAVHRTYLDHDCAKKAPVTPQKKIWPAFKGTVIRIAKGEGNLSPEQAERKGKHSPLILTEGIEDALSIAMAMPSRRVWAAGTLGNMANIPKLPCIAAVTIAADNDDHQSQAGKGLKRVVATLRERGFTVAVATSFIGKDMNDLLKGAAA